MSQPRPRRALRLTGLVFLFSCVSFTLCLAAATKKPPVKPLNINSANSEELQQVPGIGPATAEKILQMRKSYGAFKSVDDLLAIRGIGPKRLEKMRKYLTVGRTAGAKATHAAASNAKSPATTKKAVQSTEGKQDEETEEPE